MEFSTITKSGVFLFVTKDPTSNIDIQSVEFAIIEKFNKKMNKNGITLEKYSDNLKLSFTIVATSSYSTSTGLKSKHPEYSDLVVSTGHLYSTADSFDLKCTRQGT